MKMQPHFFLRRLLPTMQRSWFEMNVSVLFLFFCFSSNSSTSMFPLICCFVLIIINLYELKKENTFSIAFLLAEEYRQLDDDCFTFLGAVFPYFSYHFLRYFFILNIWELCFLECVILFSLTVSDPHEDKKI